MEYPPDAEWTFVEGQKPLDDIKFLRTIITEMRAKYKIDSKGFISMVFKWRPNGRQMYDRNVGCTGSSVFQCRIILFGHHL